MSSMTEALRRRLASHPLQPGAEAAVLRAIEAVEAQSTTPCVGRDGVWLQRIDVEGFRGIGPAASLTLAPCPGLTVVVGRNGSGKSSFAEAVELLFQGTSHRWEGRQVVWREGWRNLHHAGAARIGATLVSAADGPVACERAWAEGTKEVADGEVTVSVRGTLQPEGWTALGWSDALRTHQPWLSHPQLAGLLNGKLVDLYDEIARLLGLEDVQLVKQEVHKARVERDAAAKTLEDQAAELRRRLAASVSERAQVALPLLRVNAQALDALEELLRQAPSTAQWSAAAGVAAWTPPEPALVAALQQRAVTLAGELEALAETREGQLGAVANLLADALRLPNGLDDCPVCQREGAWDAGARAAGEVRLAELRHASRRAEALQVQREELLAAVRGVAQQAPPALLLERAPERASVWQELPDGLASAALWLERVHTGLPAWAALRERVAAELSAEDDAWAEVRGAVSAWLAEARGVLSDSPTRELLTAADVWVGEAERALRDDVFAPLASESGAMWSLLRQDSSVSLAGLLLRGAGPRRKLELGVKVDGQESSALSVMSQGELNALALCLFLPRMLRDESPFRFALIDDPVQALDPHKVDGLARVLALASTKRQVVVFTHDPRLPEALRRLGIPALITSVERQEGSRVALTTVSSPWKERLLDAERVTQAAASLGDRLIAQTVPAILREAVEAALRHALGRRAQAQGEASPEAIERLASQNLSPLLARWTGHAGRGRSLHDAVVEALGPRGAELVSRLQAGAHHDIGNPNRLRADTAALCERIVAEGGEAA